VDPMTGGLASVSVPSDARSPAAVRRWIQNRLGEEHADPATTADLVLVASELCANAVQHVKATEITVSLHRDAEWWTLSLRSVTTDSSPPDTSSWMVASPDATSGRGLGIVRALTDHVDVATGDGAIVISCRRRRLRYRD
jgi:anti-sigma regulatory factor (Ser/Thr protein kinase)